MNIIRVSNNPLALQTVAVFKKTIFKFYFFFVAKIEIISVFLWDSFFGLFENIFLKNKIGSHLVFTKVKNNKTLHTVLGFQIWSPNIVINLTWS